MSTMFLTIRCNLLSSENSPHIPVGPRTDSDVVLPAGAPDPNLNPALPSVDPQQKPDHATGRIDVS